MREFLVLVRNTSPKDLRHHHTEAEDIHTLAVLCSSAQDLWCLIKPETSVKTIGPNRSFYLPCI